MKIFMLVLMFGTLLFEPLFPTKFDSDFKVPEQRSLTMCFQTKERCACCDVFFGDCRKHTPIFVFRGKCSQLDEFIYDMQWATDVEEQQAETEQE
jgi:hypothetical protein